MPQSSRRVILIGASNVTLSFPLLVSSIMRSLPGPLQVFTAQGHGRSFCNWSHVLHRGLPPITGCGLWEELSRQPVAEETWGLVTDVGNDLIYGIEVDTVFRQVQSVFHLLAQHHTRLTYVRLPVERIMMLTDFHYRVAKKILFPGPTVPWPIISKRVLELDGRMQELAASFEGKILTPRLTWYGVDPIHIRNSQRVSAWREVLETWPFAESPDVAWPSSNNAVQLWRTAPAERSYWNRHYQTPQPCWTPSLDRGLWQY